MIICGNNYKNVSDIIDVYVGKISRFISANKGIICWSIFLGIFAFGYELFNFSFSIDEEFPTWWKFSELSKLWVQQGRWSNYFLFKLFLRESLIPYIPTFVSIVFIVISYLILIEIIKGDWISKAIFACIFITFPTNAFYMEFNTNFGISIGIVFSFE